MPSSCTCLDKSYYMAHLGNGNVRPVPMEFHLVANMKE